jgi:hypothetical protein
MQTAFGAIRQWQGGPDTRAVSGPLAQAEPEERNGAGTTKGGTVLWLTLWIVIALIGALGIVVVTNSLRFRAHVATAARSMWSASAEPQTIDRSSMNTLPAPVQRYLNIALGERSQTVSAVRFRHGGRFRARLDGPWQAIRGEQYEADNPPGFVWWGRLPLAPGVWVDARDKCVNGAGNMLVSAASTFTLSDRSGPQMDQGSMLRLLSDLVLFPSAMLNPKYVTWSASDDRHAQATLTLNGHSVSGTFEFGADGLPRAFQAERYMEVTAVRGCCPGLVNTRTTALWPA